MAENLFTVGLAECGDGRWMAGKSRQEGLTGSVVRCDQGTGDGLTIVVDGPWETRNSLRQRVRREVSGKWYYSP
jgi:hypothetical protein